MSFYFDRRVMAAQKEKPTFDPNRMVLSILLEYEDDEGDEVEETVEFPAKYTVCQTCEGKGKHVNPSIDSEGLSQEDFDEDPDFRENYFSGRYDVVCYECRGQRVVPEIDEDRLSEAQKGSRKRFRELEVRRAQWAREEAHERRMGY